MRVLRYKIVAKLINIGIAGKFKKKYYTSFSTIKQGQLCITIENSD